MQQKGWPGKPVCIPPRQVVLRRERRSDADRPTDGLQATVWPGGNG